MSQPNHDPSLSHAALDQSSISWMQEFTQTIRLAIPLIATFIGYQIMSLCDTFVSARLGTEALAAVSLGSALYWVCTIFPLGILLSLDPLVAQSLGANKVKEASHYCRQGLSLALILSVIFIPITLLSIHPQWPWIQQQASLHDPLSAYLYARVITVPFLLMHTCLRCFLQAHHQTTAILMATTLANLINLPLSLYLAGGDSLLQELNLPTLGIMQQGYGTWGIGIATTIVSIFETFFLMYCASRQAKSPILPTFALKNLKKLIYLGLPIGGALISEGGVFSASTLLASAWSITEIGAHQVTLQISSCSFTIYLGIANATAVRVGHAVGAHKWYKARQVASTGVALGVLITLCIACFFGVARYTIPSWITTDMAVIQQVGTLLIISAAFQLFDGIQVISAGALRGAGMTKIPLWSALISHWGIGLPCALLFAFYYELKVAGLWWGLCCGLAVASVALSYSFIYYTGLEQKKSR